MCRREEPEVVFSAEQQADFLCLVETAMQRNDAPDQDEQAPQAASSSMDTTGPTSVDPGSRSLDPEIRDDFECKEVEGVSLREMFYVLRGPQGERLRDSTNLFSTMYKGLYATKVLERMLSVSVDPGKILLEGQDKSFDMHLPATMADLHDYHEEERRWQAEFMTTSAKEDKLLYSKSHSDLYFLPDGVEHFCAYEERDLRGSYGQPIAVPKEEVNFFVVNANSTVFGMRFMDPDWPFALPPFDDYLQARATSINSMKHIRHNKPSHGYYLHRDAGGWIELSELKNFLLDSEQEAIWKWVDKHENLFVDRGMAALGAIISCLATGCGNRLSILVAVRTIRRNGPLTFRKYIRPVALRANGGMSDEHQRFIREARTNLRVTANMLRDIPGLFHVTTEEAWATIVREGIKPGAQLQPIGRNEGRCDIHLLTAHPVQDQLNNGRLNKMWKKGYGHAVLISLLPSAVDTNSARISQQGVLMQRTPIMPCAFDYACKIKLNKEPYEFECLFLGGVVAQFSTIHSIGSPYSEWIDTFQRNLAMCGYHGPIGTSTADRWALAQRYINSNLPQDSAQTLAVKMRCPRCLSLVVRGVTTCPTCNAAFALEKNSEYTFVMGSAVERRTVHGKSWPIMVPSLEHSRRPRSVDVVEPGSLPQSDPTREPSLQHPVDSAVNQ